MTWYVRLSQRDQEDLTDSPHRKGEEPTSHSRSSALQIVDHLKELSINKTRGSHPGTHSQASYQDVSKPPKPDRLERHMYESKHKPQYSLRPTHRPLRQKKTRPAALTFIASPYACRQCRPELPGASRPPDAPQEQPPTTTRTIRDQPKLKGVHFLFLRPSRRHPSGTTSITASTSTNVPAGQYLPNNVADASSVQWQRQ